jgi:hypothetical protein
VRLDHLLSKEPLATRSTGITPAVAEAPGRSSAPDTLFSFEGATLEHLENSIASASIYSQVSKGLRWMPWRQEPMKDASGCEKLRGAAEKALIRRCPNGETRPGSCPVTQV